MSLPKRCCTLPISSPLNIAQQKAIAVQVYEEYFQGGVESIVKTTFDILEQRIAFQSERRLPSSEE